MFSDIELACGFYIVANLGIIMYLLSIKYFLNALPRNSFPRLYVIIVRLGYIHIHAYSNRLDILATSLSLYCTILYHPVVGCIIGEGFSIRGSAWNSLLILYGPVISTNNLSQGMAYTSFEGKWPYFLFWYFFLTSFAYLNVGTYFIPYERLIVVSDNSGFSKIHSWKH